MELSSQFPRDEPRENFQTLPMNKFNTARAQLELSYLPENLPGRESEREEISDIVQRCIQERKDGSCLFITGVPGTGKTATVQGVIRNFKQRAENKVC